MKPLNGHIQIEFKEPEATNVTSSGIIVPEKDADATEEGLVIHPGESQFVEGTGVLFKSYSLIEFKRGEDKLWFVKEEDIIACYDPSM